MPVQLAHAFLKELVIYCLKLKRTINFISTKLYDEVIQVVIYCLEPSKIINFYIDNIILITAIIAINFTFQNLYNLIINLIEWS